MTAPLRIALLIRKWSTRGGNEKVATELARILSARGHDIHLYTQKIDPSAHGILSPDRIHTTGGLAFDPALAMFTFARRAEKIVNRLRATRATDVVLGFNHSTRQDVYRLGGGTHAEFLELAGHTKRTQPILDRVALRLERARFLPDRFHTIVAPSERTKKEVVARYRVDPEKVAVVWNGVDLDRFRPLAELGARGLEERRRVRAEWGVPEDAKIALFVGQDLARKGFAQAIEAAERTGAILVAVSKSARPKNLPPYVLWDGERRDIEARYRAADALILPSWYDPFGGAVLEALASGLPAVATSRIGATERVRGTPLERLILEDPSNIDQLARCLTAALDPTHAETWREAARVATRNAGLEPWADDLEQILRAACYPAPKGPCYKR